MADPVFCSFCGKKNSYVRVIVAGPANVGICNECTDLAAEICGKEATAPGSVKAELDQHRELRQQRDIGYRSLRDIVESIDETPPDRMSGTLCLIRSCAEKALSAMTAPDHTAVPSPTWEDVEVLREKIKTMQELADGRKEQLDRWRVRNGELVALLDQARRSFANLEIDAGVAGRALTTP